MSEPTDLLPTEQPIIPPEPPAPIEPVEMESRPILNHLGAQIGELSLPVESSEDTWTEKLAEYAKAPKTITIYDICDNIRQTAQEFGVKLSEAFITENITLGITQLDLTNHVRKLLFEVGDALQKGSLKDAIKEIILLDENAFDPYIVTPARILIFRNKIEDYLAVPRATTWNQEKTWT